MKHAKMINESLLDDVEVDDVKDEDIVSEDNYNVTLLFDSKTSFAADDDNEIIKKHANKVLSSCDFIERYKEPYSWLLDLSGDKKCLILIEFYSEKMSLDDFCMVVNRIAVLNSGYVIRMQISKAGDFKFKTQFNSSQTNRDATIEIFDEESFYDFFRNYFPDKSESEILKSFCKACIRCNRKDKNINYRLCFDGTYNLVDYDGNLVFEDWLTDCYDFHDGFARVRSEVKDGNDKWNFINRETGDLVSDTWYDEVCDFHEGFAIVRKNKGLLSNFIDTAGKLISDTWYSNCCDFCNGFARVCEKNRKWSFIDKQGNLLKKEDGTVASYYEVGDFSEGYATVYNIYANESGIGWNFIDTNGKRLFNDRHFVKAYPFSEGFAVVKISYNEENYIDKNGNFLLETPCYSCLPFYDGYAIVVNKKFEHNVVDKQGNFLFDDWLKYDILGCSEGLFRVYDSGSQHFNFIDKTGTLISDNWFTNASSFENGTAKVNLDDKYNYINKKGNLLLPEYVKVDNWVEQCGNVLVTRDGICIDPEGNIVSMI